MESLETSWLVDKKSSKISVNNDQEFAAKLLQQNQLKFQQRLAKVKKDTALQNQNFTHAKFSEINRPFS